MRGGENPEDGPPVEHERRDQRPPHPSILREPGEVHGPKHWHPRGARATARRRAARAARRTGPCARRTGAHRGQLVAARRAVRRKSRARAARAHDPCRTSLRAALMSFSRSRRHPLAAPARVHARHERTTRARSRKQHGDTAPPVTPVVARPHVDAARRTHPDSPRRHPRRADWSLAGVATQFTQRFPDPGQARDVPDRSPRSCTTTTRSTSARACSTRIPIRSSHRSRAAIRRTSTSDWFDVIFDSYHDRRTGYRFGVNPAGTKLDVYHFNDGDDDGSWDARWDVATHIDSLGWTAEYRIPLSQLRFHGSARRADVGTQLLSRRRAPRRVDVLVALSAHRAGLRLELW